MKQIDWSLCLIADTEYSRRINLVSTIEKTAKQGVTLVQLRSKNTDTKTFLNTAFQISEILTPLNIPFIINDRADIALACHADGVHLGQKDLPLHFARKILGKNKIIGITAPGIQQAEKAQSQGANYIGVGPVFFTESKKKASEPLGLKQLSLIRKHIRIPILAIGGINPQNVTQVISTGVDGVAVISAILDAESSEEATKKLLHGIRKIKS
jgi:thiamine-phosphate pyrophosphorylase